MKEISTEAVVIGSGAGGAVTAALLSEAGKQVLIVEEGPDVDTSKMSTNTPAAMRLLYRGGGLTPILGKPSQAFIEGCCVGGSTEINSAFWHRTPEPVIDDWAKRFGIRDFSARTLTPLFDELEPGLGVRASQSRNTSMNSEKLRLGAEKLGWKCMEVPRAQSEHLAESAYVAGAKRSMTQTFIPRAVKAGARVMPNSRAMKLEISGSRVVGVQVLQQQGQVRELVRIKAGLVFVCGGAIQTPLLLRSSGIKKNIGNSLQLHPMLKVAGQFNETMDSHRAPLPIYQIKEFAPDITLGGAVFTPGFLALTLSDNWLQNEEAMGRWRSMALYYVGTCGKGRGWVRRMPVTGESVATYRFSKQDRALLNEGLLKLCEALFAAGARRVYPGIRSRAVFNSMDDCREFLRHPVPLADMSLSVLHVFGTCPMGERADFCGADSFGRVRGFDNLYVNDGSLLPDAPGVNPQGSIMAVALRNVRRFLAGG